MLDVVKHDEDGEPRAGGELDLAAGVAAADAEPAAARPRQAELGQIGAAGHQALEPDLHARQLGVVVGEVGQVGVAAEDARAVEVEVAAAVDVGPARREAQIAGPQVVATIEPLDVDALDPPQEIEQVRVRQPLGRGGAGQGNVGLAGEPGGRRLGLAEQRGGVDDDDRVEHRQRFNRLAVGHDSPPHGRVRWARAIVKLARRG
ncbi:hypothetical protein OV079_04450 [Nannocystis pusilla]|uniref:Uncharacterized protein n=1 Tax=Nannocystis pusilla TaxID=889268 RepID=A0A9X3EJH0_9BACT|nr:hypothetical protein [Nannocystis pusilla]MCY1004835.1 hypothetical protein [Nannocystis pusilla]